MIRSMMRLIVLSILISSQIGIYGQSPNLTVEMIDVVHEHPFLSSATISCIKSFIQNGYFESSSFLFEWIIGGLLLERASETMLKIAHQKDWESRPFTEKCMVGSVQFLHRHTALTTISLLYLLRENYNLKSNDGEFGLIISGSLGYLVLDKIVKKYVDAYSINLV